ncbi:MAG: flippase [Bacteroidetes bacterium]|nr:flippase [Bacteroidota bacterium]
MFRSEGFRKYLHNTSWLFVDRVVRLGAVFLTGIYVGRYLKPTLFGQLNYASGFVGLFFALTTMGLDEIVVRDLVKHPQKRDEILGSSALLKLLGAVVLVTAVFVGTFVNHMDHTTTLMVMIIAAAELLKPAMVVEYYFLAQQKAARYAQVNMYQTVAACGFRIMLVLMKAPLVWFAWSYIVEMAIYGAISVVYYEREGLFIRAWRSTMPMVKELLQQSWPLIVFGVGLYVQAKIDQVMIYDVLKHIVGEKQAYAESGQYAAALKMIEALGFLPVIVQKALAPAITRAKLEDAAKYEDRLLNQYRLFFILFLVTAIPLYFLAEWVIVLFFGAEYAKAGYLLSLFAIRLLFTNMGVAKSSFITNESLFRYALITSVVGAALNIGMNYVLIPRYGSGGAILATIGSFFVSIFLLDLFFKETRKNFGWMMKGMATFWKIHLVR